MKQIAFVAGALLLGSASFASAQSGSLPNQKVKRPELIASYGAGFLECGNLGNSMKLISKQIKFAEVYYYKEVPTRVWIYLSAEEGSGDYVLGENETCHFNGIRTSNLD